MYIQFSCCCLVVYGEVMYIVFVVWLVLCSGRIVKKGGEWGMLIILACRET
jgi:hypothetical protein